MDPKKVYKPIDPRRVYPAIDPKEVYGRSPGDLVVGSTGRGSAFLNFDVLKMHLHVIGLTGTGKSFFLELLVRQAMHMKKGLCLIDPLGFLYDSVVNYVAHYPELAERVVFFNPAQPTNCMVGYNPMRRDQRHYPSLAEQVGSLTLSMLKVFETDPSVARRLANTLASALKPTIQAGLTPYELVYFVLSNTAIRNNILSHTDDMVVRDYWSRFDGLGRRGQKEELGSLENRIVEFARSEMIRATLAQTRNLIDIGEIIEGEKILLVNLSQRGWLSESHAYIIGTLLVNDIYHYALQRKLKDAQHKPFYLIIDEFQHFLTPNASSILETCRQKGVHMVLAHQHLGQLISQHLDPPNAIYDAVMSVARTKVIFATYPKDAEELARFFAPEWNKKEVKQELYRTTVLNYELEKHVLDSWGHVSGGGESFSKGRGHATGSGEMTSSGQVMLPPGEGFIVEPEPEVIRLTESVGNYKSALDSWSELSGQSYSDSDIESSHEALLMRPVLGQELASRDFWNYQEQHFRQMTKLMNLETQHVVIKALNQPSMRVKIKTVIPYPEDQEKIEKAFEASKRNAGQVYLTYDERLLVWQETQKLLESGQQQPTLGNIGVDKQLPLSPDDLIDQMFD